MTSFHVFLGLTFGKLPLTLTGFPLVEGTGGIPPLPEKLVVSPPCPAPTVLSQKSEICNFHAVLSHFTQTVPPQQSTPFGKPCLKFYIYFTKLSLPFFLHDQTIAAFYPVNISSSSKFNLAQSSSREILSSGLTLHPSNHVCIIPL